MNGPSLTRLTAISAPNRPVATSTPSPRSASAKPLVQALGEVRIRRAREPRTATPARVGVQRELRDDERRPADVDQRPVRPAVLVPEDPQLGGLAGQLDGDGLRVVRADAEQDDQPGPISPTTAPSTRTFAPVVRWRSALTGGWAAG